MICAYIIFVRKKVDGLRFSALYIYLSHLASDESAVEIYGGGARGVAQVLNMLLHFASS